MRIPSDIHEIIERILTEFSEGKNKDFLLGYVKGIEYFDGPEVEKLTLLQDFVEFLFSYERQSK